MSNVRLSIQPQNTSRSVNHKQGDSEDRQTSLAQVSSTEIQRLNAFYSAIGSRLMNEQAPKFDLDKEVHDKIMAILFPDILNNPISRKRNLEFITFLVMEAIREHIFLEFLFTQHQLKLIAASLEAYALFLGKEAAKRQHRYLDLVGNPSNKLALERAATLEKMLRLQTLMHNLRLEIKQIYAAMGEEFRQVFNSKAADLFNTDPKHAIMIAVPGGRSMAVNQNGLVSHIKNFVSSAITKLEKPPVDFAMTVHREVDRGAMDYIVRERPEVETCFHNVSDIPELMVILDKINQLINQSYLQDSHIRENFLQTVQIDNRYREHETQLQHLARHSALRLNDGLTFHSAFEEEQPYSFLPSFGGRM